MQHLRSGLVQDKYNDCAKIADCTWILASMNGKLTKYTGNHTCSYQIMISCYELIKTTQRYIMFKVVLCAAGSHLQDYIYILLKVAKELTNYIGSFHFKM